VSGAHAFERVTPELAGKPASLPALSGGSRSSGSGATAAPESATGTLGAGSGGVGSCGAGGLAGGACAASWAPVQLRAKNAAISAVRVRALGSGFMFRPARVEECAFLSNLAFRSKGSWGYPADFMERCRAELTISADFLADNVLEVMELGGTIVGFYSLERLSNEEVELGHLFVDPGLVRQGHGRQLLERAARTAHALGFLTLRIQGDPNAEGFYQNSGARKVGTQRSASIVGRVLPVFELDLREQSARHI
jgi:GNAT superfamily N-acetyltransferase